MDEQENTMSTMTDNCADKDYSSGNLCAAATDATTVPQHMHSSGLKSHSRKEQDEDNLSQPSPSEEVKKHSSADYELPSGSKAASDPTTSSAESKFSTDSLHLRQDNNEDTSTTETKSVAQLRADLAQISRRLEIEDQAADELHRRNEALYARLLQIRAARQHQEEQQQAVIDDSSSSNHSDSDDPGHITPDHRSMDDPDEASLECASSRHEETSQDTPPAGRAAHYCSSDATQLAGPDTKKRKSVPDQDDDDDEEIILSSNELENELEQKKPAAKRS